MKNENQNRNLTNEKLKLRKLQEQESILFRADDLLPKTTVDRELEKFELIGKRVTSIKEEKDLIRNTVREYDPMFPHKKPFFKLMYDLNKWDHLDPKSFVKPPVCALWIKQYIYGRFDREVLPKLLKMENPFVRGYIKKYKLFQFLNDKGLVMLEGFIEDAMEEMKQSKDWYDFELRYTSKYRLSVQLKLLPDTK